MTSRGTRDRLQHFAELTHLEGWNHPSFPLVTIHSPPSLGQKPDLVHLLLSGRVLPGRASALVRTGEGEAEGSSGHRPLKANCCAGRASENLHFVLQRRHKKMQNSIGQMSWFLNQENGEEEKKGKSFVLGVSKPFLYKPKNKDFSLCGPTGSVCRSDSTLPV